MKELSAQWAAQMSLCGAVVIDTEATGGTHFDEVFDVAVVRVFDGLVLFNQLMTPRRPIAWHSQQVHGFTTADLKGLPKFPDVWDDFERATRGVPLLAYNSSFDARLLAQTCKRYGITVPEWEWYCIMKQYNFFSDRKKPTNLTNACFEMDVEGGTHRALSDAVAAANLVRRMAEHSGGSDEQNSKTSDEGSTVDL